jgi:hypothetical protein
VWRSAETPSRTARVRIACTSDPACGSVMEKAQRRSPRAIGGSGSSRCSSVPKVLIMKEAMKCVLRTPDSEIHPRDSSLMMSVYVVRSRSRPPYSSGMVVPNSPISRIVATSP